jgi:hypothetical protein
VDPRERVETCFKVGETMLANKAFMRRLGNNLDDRELIKPPEVAHNAASR